jgi:hypothetical protein
MSNTETASSSADKHRKNKRRKNKKRQRKAGGKSETQQTSPSLPISAGGADDMGILADDYSSPDGSLPSGSSLEGEPLEPLESNVQEIELSSSESYNDILDGLGEFDDDACLFSETDHGVEQVEVSEAEKVDEEEAGLFVPEIAGQSEVASRPNEDLFVDPAPEQASEEVELFADDSYADILGQFLDSDFEDDSDSHEEDPSPIAEHDTDVGSSEIVFSADDRPGGSLDGEEVSLFAEPSVPLEETFAQEQEVSLFADGDQDKEVDLFMAGPQEFSPLESEEKDLFEHELDGPALLVESSDATDLDAFDDVVEEDESPDPAALRQALESAKSYLDQVQEDAEPEIDENTPLTEIAARRKKSRLKFAEEDRESGHGFFPKEIVRDHPEISLEEASQGHGFFEKSEIDSILKDLDADLGYSDDGMFGESGGDSGGSGDFGFDDEEILGANGERQYVDTAQYSSLLDSCLENVDEMAEDSTAEKKDASRQDLKRKPAPSIVSDSESQEDISEHEPLQWISTLYLGSGIVSLLSLICVCYLNFVTPRLQQEKEIKGEVLRLYGTHYQEFIAEDQFLELAAKQLDRVEEAAIDFEQNIKDDYDRNDIPLFDRETFKKNGNGLFYLEELDL